MIDFGALGPFLSFPIARALKLAEDVRLLPESCAMRDGRKWKSVPFVILYNAANYEMTPGVQQDTHAHLLIQDHSDLALRQIQTIVDEYQDRVLEDIAMWASLSVLKMVVPKSVLHYEEKTHTSKANTITRQRIAGLTRVGSQ